MLPAFVDRIPDDRHPFARTAIDSHNPHRLRLSGAGSPLPNEIPIAGGTSFHQRPTRIPFQQLPALISRLASHPHHTSPPSWRAGAHAKERRQMSNVADNLRRLVVEGEGAPDVVRNELLLVLVDTVERLTAERNETTRALWRIASALEKREGE